MAKPVAELLDDALRQHRRGRLSEAAAGYRKVLQHDAGNADALHLLGVVHNQGGHFNEAVRHLRKAAQLKPEMAEIHYNFAVALTGLEQVDDAISELQQAIALKPEFADAHNNLGSLLGKRGQTAEAEACFRRALAARRDFVEANFNLAQLLLAQRRSDEATELLERVIAARPDHAEAHLRLYQLRRAGGDSHAALKHYERALSLAPSLGTAHDHTDLGAALQEHGFFDAAIASYKRAMAIDPNFALAHMNLGNARREQGQFDEAAASYRQALAINPKHAATEVNLGILLKAQGRSAEARAAFTRAQALQPDLAWARLAACMAELPFLYRDEAEIAERRTAYEAALRALDANFAGAEAAEAIGASQPYYLAYQGQNDRALQSVYGAMVCRVMGPRYSVPALAKPPATSEPLRVGFVSRFFTQHSVWKAPLKGWLTQLDRKRFRIFGYHTGYQRDSETEIAARHCDRFAQGPFATDRWCEIIAADAPHVLIYPEVGMDPMAARLAALRLAPVQCNAWGHPDTSGYPTLDYYLSSELMEPSDGDAHYSERLVRLPNLSIYYEPVEVKPTELDRSRMGLRPSATVYWCGQTVSKYLPQYDAVFGRIAKEAGDCQFVFIRPQGAAYVGDAFERRLGDAFTAAGLSADRHCVFLPRLAPERFAGAMRLADVFLDSIGWSGCNSTLESLRHDLPIVTQAGPLMRGRHSAAILRMMGMDDLVAATVDDYVALAVRLAREPETRTALKQRIAAGKERLYRDRACIEALEAFLDRVGRPA